MRGALAAVFLLTVVVATGFALATERAWEDWFITYRHSRNLALGHGLVYQPGERVHGFTSPLGTLVPGVCCLASGDSDTGALWLFRATTIPALALGVAGFLWLGWRTGLPAPCLALLGGLLALDAKTIDFTINGMETGYMLFFLALTVLALERRSWRWLGVGWAGLMWTRPDGFVYALATGLAHLATAEDRRGALRMALPAALLGGLLYLPWFGGATLYYGSPVPHTIIAKRPYHNTGELLQFWGGSLAKATRRGGPVTSVFEPAYSWFGGWPGWVAPLSLAFTALALGQALLPRATRAARAAGLAYGLVLVYYCLTPNFPWYFPPGAALGYLGLAWALERLARWRAGPVWALAGVLLVAQAWLLFAEGRQALICQREIEGGVRRPIGLWLRQHAQPRDRVLVEALGYIGYYSGLKMLDMPGLVSPEMVAVDAKVLGFAGSIRALRPEWVVLRTVEIDKIRQRDPQLLETDYRAEASFDAMPGLARYGPFPGWTALAWDSQFTIFRRVKAGPD